MLQDAELVDRIRHSAVYQEFKHAFCEASHLLLGLLPSPHLNPTPNGCAGRQHQPWSAEVPVRLGDKIIAVLWVGEPAREAFGHEDSKASGQSSAQTARILDVDGTRSDIGLACVAKSLREVALGLLELFASQLSFFANEILIRQAEREPYRVRLARTFISNHQTEDITLSDVAKTINVSPFYLCKIFKRGTGLTLIEFRNRLRIESAKKLLTTSNQGVSEIAYGVGFQSLTQFNRLFRRIVGQSPTIYRMSSARASSPPALDGRPDLPPNRSINSAMASAA
jgi:AraC-like DNA-binding protein